MTDKFKKYLSENYDQLSPEEPDEKVCAILAGLAGKTRKNYFS